MHNNVNQNRTSPRAPWWDYSNAGAYFITICSKNRAHYFGKIRDGAMQLSPVGVIAHVLWYEILNHATGVTLGEFVVMPNHIHGILIINESVGTGHALSLQFQHALSLRDNENNNPHPRFRNPGKNTVSSIIGGYKSAVTKHANRLGFAFGWQTRFYDHIIRNEAEYARIATYIIHNPIKWKEDRFYQ